MLNKKSAFKPKAAIRRPAPGTGSQGSSQRPSPVEPLSKTPALAPQEPSPSSQSQTAPHPVPSTPADTSAPASSNGPPRDVEVAAQTSRQVETTAVQPGSQDETSSTTVPSTVSKGSDQSSASSPAVPTAHPPPASTQPEKPGPKEAPEASVLDAQATATTTPDTTSTASRVRAPLSESTASQTEVLSRTPIPTPTSATVPASATTSSSTTFYDQSAGPATRSTENASSEQPLPTTEVALEAALEAPAATKPKRAARKRKSGVTTEGASSEQNSTTPPAKRTRKRAAPQPSQEGDEGQAAPKTTGGQKRSRSRTANGETEDDDEGSTARPKRKPSRPQREATPEDAENVEIDVTQVKMADLAKDMRVGKKFSLHDELMERERAKRLRYNERRKRQQSGEDGDTTAADGEGDTNPSPSNQNSTAQETPAEAATDDAPAETNRLAPIGEQYQIIDGEIVLDHRSLQVDRHARAREAAGELVEVEENDFTHHTTSATYLRRNLKPQQWTDEETDLFYQALSAFGTDFDTICRMFKGKTRKHIKLKFNREERVNPQRINAALVGQKTVAMNMDEYQRHTGQEYESAEAIYAEQKRAEEEFEARQRAIEDEKADEIRRKKEEVLAQLNTSVEGENADGAGGGGGGKKGRGGRKKKAQSFVGL